MGLGVLARGGLGVEDGPHGVVKAHSQDLDEVLRTFLASYFWPNWDRKDLERAVALTS